MAQRRRIAVVGAGYFSPFHLQGWAEQPDAEVVAVCDLDAQRAGALAKRFEVPSTFTSLADLLRTAQPDVVDLVTPPAAQAALLEQLLAQRLPVICQKPFGSSYREAARLARLAQDARTPLVVHENFRFMPWFREARRAVEQGLLGTLHGISFRLRPGDGQGPQAYLDRQPYFQAMPRLLVAETAIHFIDTFRYLVGEIQAVYARLRRLNPVLAGEDAGLVTFEFEGGVAGLFDGNRLNDHVAGNPRRTLGEMWLEGSAGVLRLDGDARLWFKPHRQPETEHAYERGSESAFGGGACGALQRHVLDALAAGREPENTAQAYLRNLRVQEAVYASHRSGRRIVIDEFDPLESAPAFPFQQPKETAA